MTDLLAREMLNKIEIMGASLGLRVLGQSTTAMGKIGKADSLGKGKKHEQVMFEEPHGFIESILPFQAGIRIRV